MNVDSDYNLVITQLCLKTLLLNRVSEGVETPLEAGRQGSVVWSENAESGDREILTTIILSCFIISGVEKIRQIKVN